jgi:response regulator RpfG family c-di-GMP phosphodiesterase
MVEYSIKIATSGKQAIDHDTGKIGIPDSILLKPGILDWTKMSGKSCGSTARSGNL